MALTAAQKELRLLIKRGNTRLKRLLAAGIQSPAAERALAALGGATNFNLGKHPTKSYEALVRRVVTRFLKAETSTVSGYKKVEKKRAEGIKQQFRDMGVTASDADIKKAMQGAATFAFYEEIYSVGSPIVNAEFAQGAQEGLTREQIEKRMRDKYKPNPNIQAREFNEGEGGTETAYRPLTKEERQTARERRAEIFEDIDAADVDELFGFPDDKKK